MKPTTGKTLGEICDEINQDLAAYCRLHGTTPTNLHILENKIRDIVNEYEGLGFTMYHNRNGVWYNGTQILFLKVEVKGDKRCRFKKDSITEVVSLEMDTCDDRDTPLQTHILRSKVKEVKAWVENAESNVRKAETEVKWRKEALERAKAELLKAEEKLMEVGE